VFKGKQEHWVFTDHEKNVLVKELGEGWGVQRYKGLGEMNDHQLWDTTMDPANRILLLVTIEDALLADELFTILMGDEVEPRKQFITAHAKDVINLDV
jgi:DNA gyrase subunit B